MIQIMIKEKRYVNIINFVYFILYFTDCKLELL